MDAIVQARDDRDELGKLLLEERAARRLCHCADKRLHEIDCALTNILQRKSDLIERRRRDNIALSGAA